ncbi:hypothetical protein BGZ47_010925 [Haplosporangium gracile]|nr:hypothetical protein BGZ47_010925 [Haplosporangium gracile]
MILDPPFEHANVLLDYISTLPPDTTAESWVCTRLKELTMVVRTTLDNSDSDFNFVNDLSDDERRARFQETMVLFSQQLSQLSGLQGLDIRRSTREDTEASEVNLDEQEVTINTAGDQNFSLLKPTGYQNGWLHGLLTLGNLEKSDLNTNDLSSGYPTPYLISKVSQI